MLQLMLSLIPASTPASNAYYRMFANLKPEDVAKYLKKPN